VLLPSKPQLQRLFIMMTLFWPDSVGMIAMLAGRTTQMIQDQYQGQINVHSPERKGTPFT